MLFRSKVGLSVPAGIVFNSKGNLLVTDLSLSGVREFDGLTGAYVTDFVTSGSGGLVSPFALTFGSNGNLYVLTLTGEVYQYDGETGASIGLFTTVVGAASSTFDMAFGANGNLFISDTVSSTVLEFDGTNGTPLGPFTSGGALTRPISFDFGPDRKSVV